MKEREPSFYDAAHEHTSTAPHTSGHTGGGGMDSHHMTTHHYMMFAVNMAIGLAVMYAVMFTMIDGPSDFRNNVNMLYMAVTMWAPMGIVMLLTMRQMYRRKALNLALHAAFAVLTVASFAATRAQALVGDEQFIASMIPHHSGAILMCREARLSDPQLVALCRSISEAQRKEIQEMNAIQARLQARA